MSVFVQRKGGLGNQIFQVVAGYIWSKDTNKPLVILDELENKHNLYNNNYCNTIFSKFPHSINKKINSHYLEYNQVYLPWIIVESPKDIFLNGFFQCVGPILRNEKDIINKILDGLPTVDNIKENSVGLHIRRGDYLKHKDYHYNQPDSYYIKALSLIGSYDNLYVFSDDIDYCKKLDYLKNAIFIEEKDELRNLAMMAKCKKGFICANSTFSWWGAFIGARTNVIIPKEWIKQKIYDLFPSEWVIIEDNNVENELYLSITNIKAKHLLNISSSLQKYLQPKRFQKDNKFYFLSIEDTINYSLVEQGREDLYSMYIKETPQGNHTIDNFKKLIKDFDVNKMSKVIVTLYDALDFYLIEDGVHRLCILKNERIFYNSIPLSKLNIIFAQCLCNALKNKLKQTTSKLHYNGWHNRLEFGYHSFNIFNFNVKGQRDPIKRLEKIKNFYDFTGKKVLDLGCNSGGMLFHLNNINSGIGLDFDLDCIDFCNYLKNKLMFFNSLRFYVKDLNDFDCENYCQSIKFEPDIIFLLSLGSWVKNWKDLYYSVAKLKKTILLETNNDNEGLPQLDFFNDLGAKVILVSNESDDDITGNLNRKTYLISF